MSEADPAVAAGAKATGRFDYKIIDTDQHVNPPHEFWKDYLPAKFADLAPRIEHADDSDYVVFEGQRKKINAMVALAGTKAEDFSIEGGRVSDWRKGNYLADARLADMDMDGVDVAIMYGGGPLGTANPELYIESFRAYTRFVNDFCSHDRKRLIPVGYVCTHDVDVAISQLKEIAAMGITTINMPAFPIDLSLLTSSGAQSHSLAGNPMAEVLYDDPKWDPYWATVCDLDVAVTFHLGGRATRYKSKQRILSDMVTSKMAMIEPVAVLLFGGVFDRFPNLRVGTIESGGGWLAFATDYMDRTWEKQRFWTESKIKHYPHHYMENNVYASFIHDRVAIECCHMLGAKNVMWSTDYPHSETSFPDTQKWIDRLFDGIPEADKKMILHDTPAKFFRLG